MWVCPSLSHTKLLIMFLSYERATTCGGVADFSTTHTPPWGKSRPRRPLSPLFSVLPLSILSPRPSPLPSLSLSVFSPLALLSLLSSLFFLNYRPIFSLLSLLSLLPSLLPSVNVYSTLISAKYQYQTCGGRADADDSPLQSSRVTLLGKIVARLPETIGTRLKCRFTSKFKFRFASSLRLTV